MLERLGYELLRMETSLRAAVPWETGSSRLFLWASGVLVIVSVSVAGAKALGLALSAIQSLVTSTRKA